MDDSIEPVRSAQSGADRRTTVELWLRRLGVVVLLAVAVIALFNVFGQRATNAGARTPDADLFVHAPTRLRSGLLFQAKLTVVAHRTLPNTTLVLGSGWIDGLTLNTLEPSPSQETSGPGGSLALSLGTLQAGARYTQYLEYQVNPTSSSSRSLVATVKSAGTPIVSVHRTLTIWP